MKSQLLFVVILVTLGHSSADDQQQGACNRTNDGTIDVTVLTNIRMAGMSTQRLAHTPYFDGMLVVAARFLFNLGPVSFNQTAEDNLKKVIQGEQLGLDHYLNLIPAALGKPCDDIETAKKQIHAYISVAFSEVYAGAKLAVGEYYLKNLAAIEVAQSKARTYEAKFFRLLYDVIRNNINSKDKDTLNAIQSAEDLTIYYSVYDVDGLFDVSKIFGLAISNGDKNVALINDIQQGREKTVAGVRRCGYYFAGLLEAIYIKSCLDIDAPILSALSIVRCSRIIRLHNMLDLVTNGFGVVTGLVRKIAFNIKIDQVEMLYSEFDIVLGTLVSIFKRGIELFFESVLAVSPDSSCEVDEARQKLLIEINAVVGDFSKILKVFPIQINATKMADLITYRGMRIVNILIGLVPTSKSWSDEVKADFASTTKQALSSITDFLQRIRDTLNIFEKYVSSKKTNYKDVLAAIAPVQSAGLLSAYAFVDATTNLIQISLFAGDQYSR